MDVQTTAGNITVTTDPGGAGSIEVGFVQAGGGNQVTLDADGAIRDEVDQLTPLGGPDRGRLGGADRGDGDWDRGERDNRHGNLLAGGGDGLG